MPVPTMLTFAKPSSAITSSNCTPDCSRTTWAALLRLAAPTVNDMDALPSLDTFCTMTSTLIPAAANGFITAAATPGRSLMPRITILAIFLSVVTAVIGRLISMSIPFGGLLEIVVPSDSRLKLDRMRSGTSLAAATSMERGFIFAPNDAISSISS